MEPFLTQSNIMFTIGLLSIVFTVYHYFKNPQIAIERREIGVKGELGLLRQDIQNLKDNHIHTLEAKVDGLTIEMTSIKVQMAQLSTIIDERIPKK